MNPEIKAALPSLLAATNDALDCVVKVAAIVVALLLVIWPQNFLTRFRTDAKLAASITNATGSERATLADYRTEVAGSEYAFAKGDPGIDLQTSGAVVSFALALNGDLSRDVDVKATLYDASTGTRATQTFDEFSTSGNSQDDTAYYRIFVPLPQPRRRYFALIEALTSYPGNGGDGDVAIAKVPLDVGGDIKPVSADATDKAKL